jgi:hypothetical protein
VTDHLGGDALEDLALGPRGVRQREIGVRLDVDEPRRHHEPIGLDHAPGRPRMAGRDGGDPAVAHRGVGAHRLRARAVQERAAADDEVVHARPDATQRRSDEQALLPEAAVGPS